MPRYCLLGCALCAVLWLLSLPAPAAAFDLLGWLKGNHRSHTAEYLDGVVPGTATVTSIQPLPALPVFDAHCEPVPGAGSYNWGYFGAPYRPVEFCHQGYHGDCSWVRYRRP